MKVKELIEVLFYAFNPEFIRFKNISTVLALNNSKCNLKEGGEDGRT